MNTKMTDFDYEKHSLSQIETWVRDALTTAEVTPQKIYDTIKGVVEEEYYYFKHYTGRCYELLALLNGNGKGHIQSYDEYNEKKRKLECDNKDPSPECQKSWNSFWEEYYYPEEVKNDNMKEYSIANQKKDKVVNWVLPVEETKIAETDEIEYFITFPNDLLEAADLKEGDKIEWIDQGDGSYLLKKSK